MTELSRRAFVRRGIVALLQCEGRYSYVAV